MSKKTLELLGPQRHPVAELTPFQKMRGAGSQYSTRQLAASAQLRLEQALLIWHDAKQETGAENVFGGGKP